MSLSEFFLQEVRQKKTLKLENGELYRLYWIKFQSCCRKQKLIFFFFFLLENFTRNFDDINRQGSVLVDFVSLNQKFSGS